MAPAFSAELALSSGDLGLLSGAYFFGFALTPGPDDDDGGEPWAPAGTPWSGWPDAGDGHGEVSDLAFWRAAGRKLLDCLDELPAAQKTVFLLHHEDGLSLDELSRALGVGFETAKSRLRYAMGKLRGCMGAHLPAELLS